jgi:hypothetical protein
MRYLILLFALVLVGCPPPVVPNPPPPPADTDMCGDAEATLERLQCKDSLGDPMWVNKRGERFAETCRIAQEEALIFLDPKCITNAATCKEANECPTQQH